MAWRFRFEALANSFNLFCLVVEIRFSIQIFFKHRSDLAINTVFLPHFFFLFVINVCPNSNFFFICLTLASKHSIFLIFLHSNNFFDLKALLFQFFVCGDKPVILSIFQLSKIICSQLKIVYSQ